MKKIILAGILFYAFTASAQTFYQKFPTALDLDYDVAAIEIANGYILGDNEIDANNNFHNVIRLARTDYSGNIIWAKKYDANSVTIHLLQLLKTSDNYILALGYIGPDNNAIASQRFIMKLDTTGNLLWAKEYSSLFAYQQSNIVQASDSVYIFSMGAFSGGDPVVCGIDSNGNVLSASKFNVTNSNISRIVIHNNSLDLVLGDVYVLNTNLAGSVINWQRQYNNTLQFTSLLSNRCANGDLIFIAGQIAGGFGDGTSRIFRTDSLGNLKWARNILAWRGATSNPGTNFDAVSQVAINESADGNIVGASVEEGGTLLFSVFDSLGNYLYNRNRTAMGQQHCVAAVSGNYLVGSVVGFQNFSTFSSYPLSPANPCDSILSVSVTTGVDSMAITPSISVGVDTVTSVDVTVSITPISISPVLYCNPVGMEETGSENTSGIHIYPNPASGILNVYLDNLQLAQITITNVLGEVVLKKPITYGENQVGLGEINSGIYFVTIISATPYIHKEKLVVTKR